MQARTVIEGWPALMSTETAARYLSLEESRFMAVAAKSKVHAVEVEPDLPRWRKTDLDRLIRRLTSAPSLHLTAVPSPALRIDAKDVGRIADLLAERLSRTEHASQRTMISIKEAGLMLGIGRSSIYRLIGDGKLITRKIGRRTLIPIGEIQSILEGHPSD